MHIKLLRYQFKRTRMMQKMILQGIHPQHRHLNQPLTTHYPQWWMFTRWSTNQILRLRASKLHDNNISQFNDITICWTVSFESSQHHNFRYDELMKMVEKTNGIIPEAQKQIMQKVIMYKWGYETQWRILFKFMKPCIILTSYTSF